MNILVTAGNTLTPIDRVRGITNIFTGRTGARMALRAHEGGHVVTLLTSHPEVVPELRGNPAPAERWTVRAYRTFDELRHLMAETIGGRNLDAVIHCAAVSDYQTTGIYAPAPGTRFRDDGRWESDCAAPTLVDRAAGKVKSDESELWLRLARTPKLIDFIRTDWDFHGVLVKFKLETGLNDEQLIEVAERSRRQSNADLMVGNTLEGLNSWAYLGPVDGSYQRVSRRELAARLLDAVEHLHGKSSHG
jgi:phosphopantothenate-cysteine ligase/phosphopantothenoylcysteine decarboxylase/phosphopantothenate--cysteine ligase